MTPAFPRRPQAPATHRDFTSRLGGRGAPSDLPGFLLRQKSRDGAFQSPRLCSSWSPSPRRCHQSGGNAGSCRKGRLPRQHFKHTLVATVFQN